MSLILVVTSWANEGGGSVTAITTLSLSLILFGVAELLPTQQPFLVSTLRIIGLLLATISLGSSIFELIS